MPVSITEQDIQDQRDWSIDTFGPGHRTSGLIDHIIKELGEIQRDPLDIYEWADVIILALDGAWRAGWNGREIIDAYHSKMQANYDRTWPDWRTAEEGKAIEHVR